MLITALANEVAEDIESTLSSLKKLGVKFVELKDIDNAKHLKEKLDRYNIKASAIRDTTVETAKQLDCRYIITSQTETSKEDITYLFENQTHTVKECVKILENSNMKMHFNPANFLLCGEDVKKAFDMLLPYIKYVRIKDVLKDGRFVPSGAGDCEIKYIINTLKDKGFDGFLSIEHSLGKNDEQTFLFALNSLKIIL